jgi:hypothetical protein
MGQTMPKFRMEDPLAFSDRSKTSTEYPRKLKDLA